METSQPFSIEIKQYLAFIRRWAWLIAFLALLGGVLVYFFSLRQPKIYQASATVIIDQRQLSTNEYSNLIYNERLSQTYAQMIVQQPTLEGVIHELGLVMDVPTLQKQLEVSAIPETQLLRITIQDNDPQRAASIVNTIGTVFARENAELQASRYQEIKTNLETQLRDADQQIQDTLLAIDRLDTTQNTYVTDILQIQLNAYQEIYQGLLKQIFELETLPQTDQDAAGQAAGDPSITSPIQEQLAIIEEEIVALTEAITAKGWVRDAEYDLLNMRLNVFRTLYQQLTRDLLYASEDMQALTPANTDGSTTLTYAPLPNMETLSAQLGVTAQRIQQLTTEIGAQGGGGDTEVERDRLESNLVLYRQTYASLVQSYEQVRLAETQNTTRVDLVQPATPPTEPISPKITQSTLLGAIIGLMLGGGIALIIELLDDTVKGPEDIIHRLQLPVLGYLPAMVEDSHYPIAALQPRSNWSESFRSLRTNIQYTSIDHPINSLMVTSPTPRDGKSTVAANLGVVLAQGQFRVSLIDADLRRPYQHKIFDLPNRNGLTDALIRPDFSLNGSLKPTKVENLSILTTGDLPPNPAELIGSDKMLSLIRSLRQHTDIVIIDTPPVMAVTDPVALSTRVDGVIVIVRPGVTKLAALLHTIEQLRQVGANILGVVLNDAENKGARYGQYYRGYYYQYGSYYAESADDSNGDHHSRRNGLSA